MESGLFSTTLHFELELRINSHTRRALSPDDDDTLVPRIFTSTFSLFVFGVITPVELPSGLVGLVDVFTGGFSWSKMEEQKVTNEANNGKTTTFSPNRAAFNQRA